MSIQDRLSELRSLEVAPSESIRRGEHAKRLLDDEVLRAAAAEVEIAAMSSFFTVDDPEIRDAERVKALAVELIFKVLEAWAIDGEYEHRMREDE